jgi:hypothetical protein
MESCHPERSEGSDREAVILSEAKDLSADGKRSLVAKLLGTTDERRLDDGACRALRPFASSRPQRRSVPSSLRSSE